MRPTVSASLQTLRLWDGRVPSHQERETFLQIVSSVDSRPGFNISCDISTGIGSIFQAQRFSGPFHRNESVTRYYANVEIPLFEEQLAPALLLGFEHRAQKIFNISIL
jgi:hypothetical protein